MAVTVRFFAALRDAAGTSKVEVEPGALPQIVSDLCERYGEQFAARVMVASGLLDGQPVRIDDEVMVADGCELALLPPFSGGSAVATRERRVEQLLLAGSLLLPTIIALGVYNERWAFGLVVIVIGLGSLIDLHTALGDAATRTVLPAAVLLAIGPVLLLLIGRSWAGAWIPGLVALSAMLTFLLTLASPRRRDTASIVGSTLIAGLFVAFGTSALLLLYDAAPAMHLAGALGLLALTDAAGTVVARRPHAHGIAEMLSATLAVAAVAAVVLWVLAGRPAAFLPMVGYAVAAVVAAVVSARMRSVLRRRTDEGAHPQPALLIGTADAVLIAAPVALVWLELLAP